ncbi:MAG: PEP-utilizing enzyme [Dehalococcoidia bacterium]
MSVIRVYGCFDGREFPAEFASEADAALTWYWDPEHNPEPLTPMEQAVWTDSRRGASRARTECGFDADDVFIGGAGHAYFNGFYFARPVLPSRRVRTAAAAANRKLAAEFGSAASFWERWCEPRAEASFEELKSGAPDAGIAGLIDVFGYGFEQTFLMFGLMQRDLRRLLSRDYGADAPRLATELMAGRDNATLQADQALWDLAAIARESPEVEAAVRRGASRAELEEIAGAERLLTGLDVYLDRYGWRTLGWNVSSPSLRERPDIALKMVRRLIEGGVEAPANASSSVAERRRGLEAEVIEAAGADRARRSELERAIGESAEYLAIKEGRALHQLSLTGALRGRLLERGSSLVRRGLLANAEDILYLTPDEADVSPAESPVRGLADLAGRRRSEREQWVGVTPPVCVGGGSAPAPGSGGSASAESTAPLEGLAASPGRATGTARVIRSPEDMETFAAGDILICTTTTPAWTPLFGLAAAVVAESGDMVSHTAIAAREYGIPAVTGVPGAMTRIPDGRRVTVDGVAGVVSLD